jgi:type II secretory pathway pseudopilin PulG
MPSPPIPGPGSTLGGATNAVDPRYIVVVLVLSILLYLIGVFLQKRRKQEKAASEKKAAEIRLEFSEEVNRLSDKEPLLPLLVTTSPSQGPGNTAQVEAALTDLRQQIADLAKRLETQKNEIIEVARIDPVLEATIKGNIENLTKRIELIEKNQVTKWDAALVFLKLFGGLGIIVGIMFAIIRYYHP